MWKLLCKMHEAGGRRNKVRLYDCDNTTLIKIQTRTPPNQNESRTKGSEIPKTPFTLCSDVPGRTPCFSFGAKVSVRKSVSLSASPTFSRSLAA